MSTRKIYFLGFLFIAGLLLTSLYLQFFKGIEPCPLCTLQRLTFVLLGLLFLISIVVYKNKAARYVMHSLCGITSLLGIVLASRQIWLQHSPSFDGECGVSLQYMMQVLPLNEVMQHIFQGSTECAIRGWEFLSLNMAE